MKRKEHIDAVDLMRRLRSDADEQLNGKPFEEQRKLLDAARIQAKKSGSDKTHRAE